MNNNYLESAIKQFEYYKWVGDSAIEQVRDDHLYWQFNSTSNSIATIVQHLVGNMHSRWTDFLTTDGEFRGFRLMDIIVSSLALLF